MADKALSTLTAGTTPLDGTELFYVVQGSNSRKVAGSDVVKIAHTQAFSSITSTPTTLSGYGITDAQAKSSKLTAIAGLSSSDSGFIVGDGSTWTVESGSTARASLGLAIGSDVQAYSADLVAIAGLDKDDGGVIIGDGTSWTLESGATLRTSLGLSIGSDVQAYDASLNSLSGLTLNSGDILYSTGPNAFTNLSKGADGQVLVLSSGLPSWANVAGTGDMISAVYDPDGTGANAFDQDNMVDGTTNKNYTATEQSKLADAVVKSDTSVSGFSFAVDEDDMASDSATLLPTQQSVKANIDLYAVRNVADRTALAASPATIIFNRDAADEKIWIKTSDDISAEITAADPRYLPTSGDATGASGGFYQAGSVQTGNFFAEDGARIIRLADRLLGGDSVQSNGEAAATYVGSYMAGTAGIAADGIAKLPGLGWIERNAGFSWAVSGGKVAISGYSHSLGVNGGASIGGSFTADNDELTFTSNVWAAYFDAKRWPGAKGTTWGIELDISNHGSTVNDSAYGADTGGGVTRGIDLAVGGDVSNPVSVGIRFSENGGTFLKAMIFSATALYNHGGYKIAAELPSTGRIQWLANTNKDLGAFIQSDVTVAGNGMALRFANNLTTIEDLSGAIAAKFQRTASAVNYPNFVSAVAGSGPALYALGPDTNIDFLLYPKGSGVLDYRKGATVASSAPAFSAVRYFPIKLAGTTHYVPCSPATW